MNENRFAHLLEGDARELSDESLAELLDTIHATLDDGIHAHFNPELADKAVTDKEHWELWDRFYALNREKERRAN